MEPTTTSSSPSSTSSTTNQEEPSAVTTGNPTLESTDDLQLQQMVQLMRTYDDFMKQDVTSFLLQTLMSSQTTNWLAIPGANPENDSKENKETPKKVLMIEENESTSSPREKRLSTEKTDRRTSESTKEQNRVRERNRKLSISKTFEELKICLPFEEAFNAPRLTILKVATAYIGFLGAILADDLEEKDMYQERLHQEMESAKPS